MTTATHTLSAEDIGRRVLKLIDSIRTTDDIAPAHIEQVTGMKVDFNPDDSNEYGFGGQLTEHWDYNLVSLTEPSGDRPTRLMFSFDDRTRGNADMGPICGMDFDAYARSLKDAGYASSPVRGRHDRITYWDFSRGEVSVQVYVRGENDARATHDCVSKVIINA